MERLAIDGLEDLCLGDELTKTVAAKLGAVPKTRSLDSDPGHLCTPPPPASLVTRDSLHNEQNEQQSSKTSLMSCTGSVASTPAMMRRQMKKKNRKDRRRDNNQDNNEAGKPTSTAAHPSNGSRGIARSNSARSVPTGGSLAQPSTEEITKLLFKSQSTVNVKTGIKNLPDSFFTDDLPDENQENEEKKNKRRRKKKGRKKVVDKEMDKETDKEVDREDTDDKELDNRSSEEKEIIIEDVEEDKSIAEDRAEDNAEDKEVDEDGFVYNWRNVTKNGDIKKCVLVEGNREEGRPMKGDIVVVKSQGKLKDGTMIDDYPTLVFRVGEYEVVQGLDLCVQSMLKNELAIVSLKPGMAYGELGRKPDIPSNARITYLFGLLHFEKQKEISELTWAQRRKMGQSRMRIANWWYSRKEYSIAVKCYKRALLFYNNIPTDQKCSTSEEYRELLTLMEERLRVMRQVANIFKRIANLIQSGHIET